jgi:hypothetical protein
MEVPADVQKALLDWQEQRRRSILSELAIIEKQLILAGRMSGPTTSELRQMWRDGGGIWTTQKI